MTHPEFNRKSLTAASLSGLGMAFSTGPIVLATFALFMLPMAKEFGWGRADISLGLTISAGCAALADPIIGRLVDRLGVRRVLLPGMILFALANAALAFVTQDLALLYLIFAVVGTSSVTCAAVPYSKMVSAWFQEKRGLVLGLFLGVGAGAGAALISQIVRFLIVEFGWRDARLALSGMILLIPLPLLYFFLREPAAQPAAADPASAPAPASTGLSAREARRTRAFWMMFAMVFAGTVALAGTVIHMVAMLTDQGLSTAGATTVYSFYAIAGVAGRILIGWAQDKTESPKIGLAVYAAGLAGLLILRYATTLPLLIPGAMLVGLGFGAQVSLAAYWVSRYWGLRCYGENYGYIYSAASAGAALGPLVMGAIFDLSGSYALALDMFQGTMIVCALLVFLMGDYVFSTRRPSGSPAPTAAPGAKDNTAETTCDVLVVGSGAGGLAAAITARSHGLDVLVVEKAAQFGGTTARSGGVLWIPGNPVSRDAGVTDSLDRARAYLRSEIGPRYDERKVEAYLAAGPQMVDFFQRNTAVQFTSVDAFPDYHPDAPGAAEGGRSIQARAFLRGEFGPALKRHPVLRDLARPLPGATFLGLNVARDELTHFYRAFRSGRSLGRVTALLLRHFADLLVHRRSLRAVNGNALAARLGASASALDIPIWLAASARDLIVDDGRIVGAMVDRDGKPIAVRARHAVILASGGFPHDRQRRAALYPHGSASHFSVAAEGNVGDGARLSESAGGKIAVDWPSAAAWTPVSSWRDKAGQRRIFPHFIDRGKPGIIAVAPDGRRFVNESAPYPDIGFLMARMSARTGTEHGWLIADHRAFRRYGLGIARPAPVPFGIHLRSGYLVREPDIAALAARIGVDRNALEQTVEDFNRDAHQGKDRSFGKGDNVYNRYQGDPAHRPNPCLAPLETPPFYAVRITPGDIGTFAGIITDADARVLDGEDRPIAGLYAVGNDQASVFGGSYPGGGATLGPAMTFGFIAARHIAASAPKEHHHGI